MDSITIAAAQPRVVRGDIAANVAIHLEYTKLALEYRADAIVFPELSLTGYEPDIANASTLSFDDRRLSPLNDVSRQFGITVIVGVPVDNRKQKPYIAALIISPKASFIYRKNYLHPGEETYFSEGEKRSGIVNLNGMKMGLAICADIDHDDHVRAASMHGAGVYAAGVLMVGGYSKAAGRMQHYAKEYSMLTLMANYGQATGGYIPAGKSAAWDNSGNLLAEAPETGECLVVVTGYTGHWTGRTVRVS